MNKTKKVTAKKLYEGRKKRDIGLFLIHIIYGRKKSREKKQQRQRTLWRWWWWRCWLWIKSHASKWDTRVIPFHFFFSLVPHSLDLGAFNWRLRVSVRTCVFAHIQCVYILYAILFSHWMRTVYVQMPKYVYNFICLAHLWIESTIGTVCACISAQLPRIWRPLCALLDVLSVVVGVHLLLYTVCWKWGMVKINYLWNISLFLSLSLSHFLFLPWNAWRVFISVQFYETEAYAPLCETQSAQMPPSYEDVMAAEKAILTKYGKLCTSTKCCEHSQLNRLNATSMTKATTTAATAAAAAATAATTAEQFLANGENSNAEQINITDHSTETTTNQPTMETAPNEVAMEVTENGNTIPDAVNKLLINYW